MRGLTAQLSYTWSKNMTDSTNDRDGVDLPQVRDNFAIERAVSRFDRTHVFKASYVYELPSPRSGLLARPFLNQVFGGWELSGITTAPKPDCRESMFQATRRTRARAPTIVGIRSLTFRRRFGTTVRTTSTRSRF